MTDKPMTVGEWITMRVSRLTHTLEILTYNDPGSDVFHWAEGRKEQIKDELEFLDSFQILYKNSLSNGLIA